MVKIILHGFLKKRFGSGYNLAVRTTAEAVRALCVNFKGFDSALRGHEFRVFADREMLDESLLGFTLGSAQTLHFVPMPNGSKRSGVLKVVLGVAMLGIGFAVAGAAGASAGTLAFGKSLVTFGAGMLLNGISQMLSPTPTVDSNEKADTKQSYLFSGATNVTTEGNIIPVAYGKPWCGSLVLSAGMDVQQVI